MKSEVTEVIDQEVYDRIVEFCYLVDSVVPEITDLVECKKILQRMKIVAF
jgi:hypothetical protein